MLRRTDALTDSINPKKVQVLTLDASAAELGSIRNNTSAVFLEGLEKPVPNPRSILFKRVYVFTRKNLNTERLFQKAI